MKIELHQITVREVWEGFKDDAEEGVCGYGGKLDIRPKYQREFIYKDDQRDAVIDTVRKGFPLNVMYWVKNPDGRFELLDGQQRTLSVCKYVNGDFSVDIEGTRLAFHNLTDDRQKQILDYELMVYFCEGTDSEKLDWFRIVNIAGVRLEEQELRNAVYTGPWLTDAKRHFSKTGCVAYKLGSRYLAGSAIRQDYLETAIRWLSGGKIEEYMSRHQHDPDATELWLYFQSVINWVEAVFTKYRKEMQGVEWGDFYNRFKDKTFDARKLEKRIAELMEDDEVTCKKGIYAYVLTGEEKSLSIRAFTSSQKRSAYERQKGICAKCKKHFEIEEMEGDHITPWHEGGKTVKENCQMLCKKCNREKSGK